MNLKRIISWGILLLTLILAGLFLIPRTYDVLPFRERSGTQYWQLNTGSVIGYTKVESPLAEQKNPMIYLHGGPGGKITDKTIQALQPLASQGHDLYFYDQIGSGHSERLENIADYTVERHQKDLAAIVEKIGAKEVILIGHSWGSMLAIQYLQNYPEKVDKIILDGPGPILPVNWQLGRETPPDSLNLQAPEYSNKEGNRQANNLRSRAMEKWAYLFNRKLASDKEADDFFTFLNQALSRSTYCVAPDSIKYEGGGGYYAHIMTFKSFAAVADRKIELKDIQTPVLILRGQCDNQKWGYTSEYLRLLPNASLKIIPNSGHDLIGSSREQYFELVSTFLNTEE
jgi:proline iminopeptidase